MSTLTPKQRRLARARLKSGAASCWLEACDWARITHPDTSDDVERQWAKTLARARGRKAILA